MYDLRRSFLVAVAGLAVVITVFPLSRITAQSEFSGWSAPDNLGPVINSAFDDAGPSLSNDRLSLYFSSNRPGGVGLADIFVSHRNSVDDPWGPPVNLGGVVNSPAEEATPRLSRDGHWLFFMSRRDGSQTNAAGVVGFDIYASYRENVHDDFDWQPPVNLGPNVNSNSFDQSPFLFDNKGAHLQQLFFTRTTPITGNDIFVSNRLPDGTFGPATLVEELNSTLSDAGAALSLDGLEVFLYSRRPHGLGNSDLWTATRDTLSDPWLTPVNLGPLVNSVDLDFDPYIASDGETLYFISTRTTGGFGGQDIWVTTRTKNTGKSGH
jgi:hypothetical protein